MNKEDKRDLLKLADIIEGKKFFNQKKKDGLISVTSCLPENKRDGTQFSLKNWFFDCGMPACVAGHAIVEFPERFGYSKINPHNPDMHGICFGDFCDAFNLPYFDARHITMPDEYEGENPNPKTVAKRIREVVSQIKLENTP